MAELYVQDVNDTLLPKDSRLPWDFFREDDLHLIDFEDKDYKVFYPKLRYVSFHPNHIKTINVQSFNDDVDLDCTIYEDKGLALVAQSISRFCYLNPHLPTEVYKTILGVIASKCTNPLPQRIFDFILDDVLGMMYRDELNDVVQSKAEKSWIIRRGIDEERAKLAKSDAITENALKKNLHEIRDVLSRWDFEVDGKLTNETIAKKVDLKPDTIRKKYSKHIKEDKKAVKDGSFQFGEEKQKDPTLFYDVCGVGYNIYMLNSTEYRLYFPIPDYPEYLFTNFCEVVKRKSKKTLSWSKDNHVQVSVNGGRKKLNRNTLIEQIFFGLIEERTAPIVKTGKSLFDMTLEEIQESIKKDGDQSRKPDHEYI